MGHMRKYDRDESEVLREKYETLFRRIKLIYRSEDSSTFSGETIGSDSHPSKIFHTSEYCGSRIFETEESIVDTLVESIFFVWDDTPTRSDHLAIEVESDEDSFF
jgi:hypothetical protein